jgi:hypothetical protein
LFCGDLSAGAAWHITPCVYGGIGNAS